MSDNGGDKADRSGHMSWGDNDLDFGENKSGGSDEAPQESSDYQKDQHTKLIAEGYTFDFRDKNTNVYRKGEEIRRVGGNLLNRSY